jgi:hypothetical protein
VTVHELSRTDARRIAVRAQLLGSSQPAELLDVVGHLTLLQIDPTAAIAPSADLVAWSRLWSSYSPAELDTALADRTLLELRVMIRPSEDLALYRADMADWARRSVGANAGRPLRVFTIRTPRGRRGGHDPPMTPQPVYGRVRRCGSSRIGISAASWTRWVARIWSVPCRGHQPMHCSNTRPKEATLGAAAYVDVRT